ncbi:MAG TPA: hypothetical protein VMG37_11280 [Solirubrobacteraceae bacterium]|nr:hypothetical protein [Solirubrobacteraceae bacterium]
MATQSPTQRQAAAKRAAATRKRNAAKRSASATKTSARRTRGAATGTARNARSTARTAGTTTAYAADTAAKAADTATTQFGAVARSAQRAVLIPVGALALAGDAVRQTALTYTSPARRARQLDQLERRGARALAESRLSVGRRTR